MKIGFIGLGIMGKPMAKNLLKAGFELIVYNRSRPSMDELVLLGAQTASGPKGVAEAADVIITMLPDSPQVEEVLAGSGGVLEGIRAGTIVIEMSSINPVVIRRLSLQLAEKGCAMLDAPVSGGEIGAIEGKLAIMVGGSADIFERMKPILDKIGATITRVGEIGAGNTVKLINQIMVAVNIASVSEALAFGKEAGIDPRIAYEAIKSGLAASRVLDNKINNMADGTFIPGFRVDLHKKDLNNALLLAEEIGIPLSLTWQMADRFDKLIELGFGREDHSALYRLANGGEIA
ncbi:2-hydroxy-3-oxopropionate reductase [Neobacillus sp. NRS-1170]|uniref:2-hydroxy-3-oxopropionate reductase n=1 Tax=Neobacillus sp. NRS-1170 TaxID=3233898 RepID=UPI003D2DD81D